MYRWTVIALAALLASTAAAQERLQQAVTRDYAEHLASLFVRFHRNPELSFREHQTAARLAAELRSQGVEVTEGVGGTGVVGLLRNGAGPTVLVRADMDGLPILEQTGLDYASRARQVDITGEEVPVMHGCGHDVHMTALIGTARQLVRLRDAWSGTVLFVGQPAEERISGARAMLEDGLYERFGVPDYALALHVAAGEPAGRLEVREGLYASSSDSVDLIVRGVGAHGASPHKGKDPIYIGAQIVIALQGLVSRELPPRQPGVVTVGAFHAGFKHNIIPDEARLQLTVRSNDEEVRQTLLSGIKRIAEGVGRASGLAEDRLPVVIYSSESTPPTINDAALAQRIRTAFIERFGEERLYESRNEGMGAEDFAYFLRTEHRVPGCYFSVGGTSQADLDAELAGGPPVPSHHSPFFRIEPEPSVTSGVLGMTSAVLELLGN